jgi:hypothetical protein
VRIGGGADGAMITSCANADKLVSAASAVTTAKTAFTANVGEARFPGAFITVSWR